MLDGAKRILGCSLKTCNEAVGGDMGLDTLQSRRDNDNNTQYVAVAIDHAPTSVGGATKHTSA